MPLFSSKVTPVKVKKTQRREEEKDEVVKKKHGEMFLILLHTLFRMCGGQRHPKLPLFEVLMKGKALTEYKYARRGSTIIYISHEWAGTEHPDPRGDQMYHLLLLLERLQRGDVDRTDMDAFHSLLYKQNHTTTAEDWKRMCVYSQMTYIFYDGFCVSKEKRVCEGFQMMCEFIKRCDFMCVCVCVLGVLILTRSIQEQEGRRICAIVPIV